MTTAARARTILDDPGSNGWVMKFAGLIVDPDLKFEDLEDLGDHVNPAPGWGSPNEHKETSI